MKNILDFLKKLENNNNKAWFDENRNRYQEVKNEFADFVNQLIPAVKSIDKRIGDISSKETVFRIFRDVRFAKDKTPYKTNFGAFISDVGRKSSYAGYYIHIEPGKSMLGGGIYMPQPDILKAVREEILDNPENYKKIVFSKEYKNAFGEIWGEKLKAAPRGFPKDHPEIDLIKQKSFAVLQEISDKQVLDSKFFDYIVDVFKLNYKINEFLNKVIDHI